MAAGGACRICRQNQVRSPCCRGGFPRRSRRFRRRTDGVDLIGALLLEVLVRLRCARIAAHTGLLARRWRGLWTRLPELTFHNTAPDPLAAALSQASRPALSLLDIHVSNHHGFSPARPHSLLHTAARLAPAKLVVRIWSELPANNAGATELPCFDRTTSIRLDVMGARITLPPAGDFPALESLSLVHGRLDLGNLLSRCSRLRYLKISNLWIDSITIHLPLLDDLFLHANQQLRRVDILAPVLKNMLFDADRGIYDEFSLSFSAALVKDFSWRCHCRSSNDEIWHLWSLTLHTTDIGHLWFRFLADDWENTPLQLQPCSRVLLLHIGTNVHLLSCSIFSLC